MNPDNTATYLYWCINAFIIHSGRATQYRTAAVIDTPHPPKQTAVYLLHKYLLSACN